MYNSPKHRITYVTSSRFKKQENLEFQKNCTLNNGKTVSEVFEFDIREVSIKETLEVELEKLVIAEVIDAYKKIRVPCIVEHAGLIFEEYLEQGFPGGLTKPMWNTLKENFVRETSSINRRACAKAVVAYCDGQSVSVFEGVTQGRIAEGLRGNRDFYWDTIFIPDDPSGRATNMTYSEIVENPSFGLTYKIKHLSQSSKAMLKFLEYRLTAGSPRLWPEQLKFLYI